MKITTTKVQTTEKETPFFTRNHDDSFYAFTSDGNLIAVHDWETQPLISFLTYTPEWHSEHALSSEITSKEFEDAFARVHERLANKFETFRDTIRESKNEVYDNVTINGDESKMLNELMANLSAFESIMRAIPDDMDYDPGAVLARIAEIAGERMNETAKAIKKATE